MKKILLLTTFLLVNIAIWAQGPQIHIGNYEMSQKPNFQKFAEPSVRVMHGGENVTKWFTITYFINGHNESSLRTNSRGAEYTSDNKVIEGINEDMTGTTVEHLYGEVIIGKLGKVSIQVVATPNLKAGNPYKAKLKDSYEIHIEPAPATVTYSPRLHAEVTINSTVSITKNPYNDKLWDCEFSAASTILPKPKITTEGSSGQSMDITDYYDISVEMTKDDEKPLETDSKFYLSGDGFVGENSYRLLYGGGDKHTEPVKFSVETETAGIAQFPKDRLKVTYKYTLKEGYERDFPAIAPQSAICHLAPILATEERKGNLHLELGRDMITESNVTEEDGVYTIHVHKYGGQIKEFQYWTPNPAVVTSGGAKLPIRIEGSEKSSGGHGDIQLLYKVIEQEEGEELGTYYDDCMHTPGSTSEDGITLPGKPTGITVTANHFHVGQPGLVKVAVYAAIPAKEYPTTIDSRYERKGIVTGDDNKEYYVYSDPVYFYIDVMKNIPQLQISPDPSKMTFTAGDKITMYNRFEISGYKDNSSNGWEGYLKWGGAGSETINGIFYDHFAYTFFISDRQSGSMEGYTPKIRLNDWSTNADLSWRDWQEVTEGNWPEGEPIGLGDKINTGEKDPKTRLPIYTTVDESYLATHSDDRLKAGDMEAGMSYFSTKDYGSSYEKWSLEFLEPGNYNISYIIRPWNHTRWDIGEGQAVTYTYEVTADPIETELHLNHDYDVAFVCEDFTEPVAKVIVPEYYDLDVTDLFDICYETMAPEGDNPLLQEGRWENGKQIDIYKYTVTESVEDDVTWSVLSEWYKDESNNVSKKGDIFKVDKTTGEVRFNNITGLNVRVGVSATLKPEYSGIYNAPEAKTYTIKIVSCDNKAGWEIISECKRPQDENASQEEINAYRCHPSGDTPLNNGKFHFLEDGNLYGGTVIRGVPGIEMTIGTKDTEHELLEKWSVLRSTETISKNGCQHEEQIGYHAYVAHENAPSLDEDGLTPLRGTFYAFRPVTNGFLTVDANWNGKVRLVKRDNVTGETALVEEVETLQLIGEHTFKKPLMNGNTYYVYIEGDKLHLHGFSYEPAFVKDESTTQADVVEPFDASIFLCGISLNLPHIMKYENTDVSFSITRKEDGNPADPHYIQVSNIGEITTDHITEKQLNTPLIVKATVESPDKTLGDCVTKYSKYNLKVIDIPSYRIGKTKYGYEPAPRDTVRTTNIPTAITMTFGGWKDTDGDDDKYGDNKTDSWTYKSAGGPASRVGSELVDNSPVYNKTFDGFDYFNAANNNPVDERNRGILITGTGGNNRYTYASGTDAEKATDFTYNTTYRIPCRGAYLKFEPKESGRVLLYVVQNGSVDFHHGLTDVAKSYQIKWRPLYITDETGKPADMVTIEGFASNLKSLLPTGSDPANIAWFTQGISRCNKKEEKIRNAMQGVEGTVIESNCDFDWSQFKGTDGDKQDLLAAWPDKGEREQVVPLDNGGFIIPHKSYVRYAFRVKAGKTYFVFQTGSKFEFGGFSFVPEGFPNTCKYQMEWKSKTDDTEDMWTWKAKENTTTQESSLDLDWSEVNNIPAKENVNITLYDGKDAKGATKKRTFSAGKWNSICLPFSVSESQLQSKFGKDYVLVTVDGVNEKGQLQFIRHAHRFIEAGRPYLFKPTADCKGDKSLTFENVTIQAGEKVGGVFSAEDDIIDPTRFDVAVDDYVFKGFYSQQPMPKGSVYAAKDGLYMMSKEEGGTIGGYRALFSLKEGGQAKAMEFAIDDMLDYNGEGETTGIVYVSEDGMRTMPANVDIYTIGGMKVGKGVKALNSLKKGVYIVNGEKFIVR